MYDAKQFLEALDELESSKGISKESILKALQEALEKGFKKQLGGEDANVRVVIDAEKGSIDMAQIKNVVEDVQDDFLEISLTDAKKVDKKIKIGDEFVIPVSTEEIKKATAMSVKTVLKQKLAEFEKDALYEAYKDKIGETITGKVEKIEENGISVNIGRASVYLPRQQLIGDERFSVGDNIKLFVADVASGPKGAHIVVSRSNEGFLKRVFEEEIHEIYDGTIIIKGIAREAGERSKVAVYSHDPNVDPAGACIGPNGSRIQKVVAQLGNGQQKEKIDIITYSENPALFIMESLKPAQILGIKMDGTNKAATAVVKNDSLSLAIGKKGVNVRLACRLTGYSIDIKEQDTALAAGIAYQTFEELERLDIERKQKVAQEAFAASSQKVEEEVKPVASSTQTREAVPEGYVAPSARVYADVNANISEEERESLEAEIDREEILSAAPAEAAEKVPTSKPAETPHKETEKVVTPVTPLASVKTTKTLEDLEKELEAEAQRAKTTFNKFKRSKKKDEEETGENVISTVDPSQRMSIYTEDELKELEKEDGHDSNEPTQAHDDVDYDEYDKYYEEDEK